MPRDVLKALIFALLLGLGTWALVQPAVSWLREDCLSRATTADQAKDCDR